MGEPSIPACQSCGGTRVGLDVVGQGTGLHPPGRLVGFTPLSRLGAHVCLACGETILHATDLATLRAETERRPGRFDW